MIKTHVLGYPRIGERRELKFALEKFWRQEISEQELEQTAAELRVVNWKEQINQGLDFITVGDFSYYDQMADHIKLLGCTPPRFAQHQHGSDLDQYFHMVRGKSLSACCQDTFALEMTKWFDTNYHYLVPEFDQNTQFQAHTTRLLAQVQQAKSLNHPIKVSLIGPLTFLLKGKSRQEGFDPLSLLDSLLPVYGQVLAALAQEGVEWLQLDEPILGLDLPASVLGRLESTYSQLKHPGLKVLLATYFSELQGQISQVCKLPVDGLHIDCVRGARDLTTVLDWLPNYKVLSLGVIDGRNIWKSDLNKALNSVQQAFDSGKNEVWISASCSLLHVPYSLSEDTVVNPAVRPWLAGAREKLKEISLIRQASRYRLAGQTLPAELNQALQAHQACLDDRAQSKLVHNPDVTRRLQDNSQTQFDRQQPFEIRQQLQRERFKLPLFPTTTIGSFPQTTEIRGLRAKLKKGELDNAGYWQEINKAIAFCIEQQEALGIDVLVHGEPERNDMVEFFGEKLDGFTFSANGWVQSYGSRCVKPPILFGDVQRPEAMTVEVARFAQSLSEKPVKGMLTGPVTILQWSFVRDDQPRELTTRQIAFAIRDEVVDLETAGIGIIQIDEPAYREGLPLRKQDWNHYLQWATEAFRISASGVKDDTQIHTHMCYAEFNDILPNIAAMDADVITIETSRSDMELLRGFGSFRYPNEIGPGVYDIHSPRIPAEEEMVRLLRKAAEVIPAENLWVNPDCGLKTRNWPETLDALKRMQAAAHQLRQEHQSQKRFA